MNRVDILHDSSYVLVEQPTGITVRVSGSKESIVIEGPKQWKLLQKNVGNHDKLKVIIGDQS